jgi:hypothetical protein
MGTRSLVGGECTMMMTMMKRHYYDSVNLSRLGINRLPRLDNASGNLSLEGRC